MVVVEALPINSTPADCGASTSCSLSEYSYSEVESMNTLSKTQQRTAAVIAYEGNLGTMPWSSRQWIAEAFADDFARHSSSFDRKAFIEACKRVSEVGE